MSQNILVDDMAPGTRRITLNRPDSLNAILPSMSVELLEILERTGRDPAVRVVVLTGAGKGFCAGVDISGTEPVTWVPTNVGKPHFALHYMAFLTKVVAAFRNLPQPIIAAVNGSAAGLGYTLAMACDIAIAAKSAKFVNAFHNAGTGSEGGLSYMLPRAVGTQRAAELLLTARAVMADEAERIGLILRSVEDGQLMADVLQLAESIAANAPLDIWVTKQNLHQNMHAGSLEQAIAYETRAIAMANTTEDSVEKRKSRQEKRAPEFKSK